MEGALEVARCCLRWAARKTCRRVLIWSSWVVGTLQMQPADSYRSCRDVACSHRRVSI